MLQGKTKISFALNFLSRKRQSRDYAAACRAQGNTVTWFEAPKRNHFNIVLDWMDARSALFQATMGLMRG